jgi:hypothetical protein
MRGNLSSAQHGDKILLIVPHISYLRIPLIPATHSGAKRSPVPEDSGRLFRAIPDTPSGWIDAGDVRFFA